MGRLKGKPRGDSCPLCSGTHKGGFTVQECEQCKARFCLSHIVWRDGCWRCVRCARSPVHAPAA